MGTGFNEKRSVCRAKALLSAKSNAKDVACNNNLQYASGNLITSGDLGYLACDIDSTTFTNFTPSTFPGIAKLETVNPPLFMGQAAGAALQMKTQMWICKEYCTKYSSTTRRLRSGNSTGVEQSENEGITQNDAQEGEQLAQRKEEEEEEGRYEAEEIDDELNLYNIVNDTISGLVSSTPLRRLSSTCIEWGYKLALEEHLPIVSGYKNPALAASVCGTSVTSITMPTNLKMGVQDSHAQAGQVKVVGGQWSLNAWQVQNLPINVPVPLAARQSTSTTDPGLTQRTNPQPPSEITELTTIVKDNMIKTCDQPMYGCIEIEFSKAMPNNIRALGKLSATDRGVMSTEDWIAPTDWLCKGSKINEMCPFKSGVIDTNRGYRACSEGLSKEQFFKELNQQSSTYTWIARVVLAVTCWLAVCCICSPVTAIVEYVTKQMDTFTACIPCIGCLVDQMTNLIVGAVQWMVCILAFCMGCGSFFIVASICWAVMRPAVAIPIMILCCICCCCALCVVSMCKDNKGDKGTRYQSQSQSDGGQYDSDGGYDQDDGYNGGYNGGYDGGYDGSDGGDGGDGD